MCFFFFCFPKSTSFSETAEPDSPIVPLCSQSSKGLCSWDIKVTVLLLWLKLPLITWDWCLWACPWSTAIVRGARGAEEGFHFPPLPIYNGRSVLVSSKGWQLLGIWLLKVLGYANVSLTLRRVHSHGGAEGWGRRFGCAVLPCSSKGPVASWGFEMEAKSNRDGRQCRAWNKGCNRAVSLYYIWVEAVTLLPWVKSEVLYWLKKVLEMSTASW